MALLVREMLHDLVNSKLDFISQIDVIHTLQKLYRAQQIDDIDLMCIKLYLLGKHEEELDRVCYNHSERIVKVCTLVCSTLGYNIATILDRGMELFPHYKEHRAEFDAFVDRMTKPVYAQPYTEGVCRMCGNRIFSADMTRAKEIFDEKGLYPCRKCRLKFDLD